MRSPYGLAKWESKSYSRTLVRSSNYIFTRVSSTYVSTMWSKRYCQLGGLGVRRAWQATGMKTNVRSTRPRIFSQCRPKSEVYERLPSSLLVMRHGISDSKQSHKNLVRRTFEDTKNVTQNGRYTFHRHASVI
jgi:hypothetical protein